MIHKRGELEEEITPDQVKIISNEVEAKAAEIAILMHRLHGGGWRYFIDPISKNIFITQFSGSSDVKKRK